MWWSVANDLKTHPHCEEAVVKQRHNKCRRMSMCNRTFQTHCVGEDALEGGRGIAKTCWIGADALRRRMRVAKTASEDTLRGYGPGRQIRIAKPLSRHNGHGQNVRTGLFYMHYRVPLEGSIKVYIRSLLGFP